MRVRLVATVAAVLALAGCGGSGPGGTASASASGKLSGTLTVFAAASLTGVFTDLGRQLERDDPGLQVRFDFAGSSQIARRANNCAFDSGRCNDCENAGDTKQTTPTAFDHRRPDYIQTQSPTTEMDELARTPRA